MYIVQLRSHAYINGRESQSIIKQTYNSPLQIEPDSMRKSCIVTGKKKKVEPIGRLFNIKSSLCSTLGVTERNQTVIRLS